MGKFRSRFGHWARARASCCACGNGCSRKVAPRSIESTGVYCKPVDALLEGALEIVAANAQHVRKVPGRKTDVKDPEWIADLLCHGLLHPSFVAPPPIRELRDLTRYRRKLVESQAAERHRLLKLLETAQHQVGKRGHGRFRRIWPADAARAGRGSS